MSVFFQISYCWIGVRCRRFLFWSDHLKRFFFDLENKVYCCIAYNQLRIWYCNILVVENRNSAKAQILQVFYLNWLLLNSYMSLNPPMCISWLSNKWQIRFFLKQQALAHFPIYSKFENCACLHHRNYCITQKRTICVWMQPPTWL